MVAYKVPAGNIHPLWAIWRHHSTVLGQLLNLVPRHEFEALAKRFHLGRRLSNLTPQHPIPLAGDMGRIDAR